MIFKIVDENGTVLGAVNVYENNENGEVFVKETRYCKAKEDGYDSIFDTNEETVVAQLNQNLKRNFVAEEIVADIISRRAGEMYDEEILYEFTNEYFEPELEKIREIVDEKMQNYLEEDNLTIKK